MWPKGTRQTAGFLGAAAALQALAAPLGPGAAAGRAVGLQHHYARPQHRGQLRGLRTAPHGPERLGAASARELRGLVPRSLAAGRAEDAGGRDEDGRS